MQPESRLHPGLFDPLLPGDVFVTFLQSVAATLVAIYLIYLAVILKPAMPFKRAGHRLLDSSLLTS